MVRSISLATLVGGVLLVIFGGIAATSLSSDFSNLFTGLPTDKSLWILGGGVVLCVIGSAGMVQGSK